MTQRYYVLYIMFLKQHARLRLIRSMRIFESDTCGTVEIDKVPPDVSVWGFYPILRKYGVFKKCLTILR